ncbi:MAG: zinc ribbon domain-containing protein [Thermoplasmataceae archaeon]
MNINRCRNCGTRFLVARSVCPKCGKEDFEHVPAASGTVLESVELIATPDPYPDRYYLVLLDVDDVKVFCRSQEKLKEGSMAEIRDDDLGPTCMKA